MYEVEKGSVSVVMELVGYGSLLAVVKTGWISYLIDH